MRKHNACSRNDTTPKRMKRLNVLSKQHLKLTVMSNLYACDVQTCLPVYVPFQYAKITACECNFLTLAFLWNKLK